MHKVLLSLSALALLSHNASAQTIGPSVGPPTNNAGANFGSGDGSGSGVCGDGMRGGSELCDDGGQNGQPGFCNATCTGTTPSQCGDWMTSGNEMCDSGSWNGQPGFCNTTCSGMTQWCGDGQRTGAEVCDEGPMNGQEGYCNATCTAMIPRTPFADPARAPVLQGLEHGRVLGTRTYEASFSVGELPDVGLAPGLSVAVRVRTGTAAGRCGPACDVPLSSLVHDGAALMLDDAGQTRRFEPDGAGWREVAPSSEVVFRPATAALVGGAIVVHEVSGTLHRQFDAAGRETQRATPWGALALAYDGAGRLTSATNAAGATLSLAYDGSGRLASVTDPTGFAMTLRYAGDGHLISLEGPADGQVTPNISLGWMGEDLTSVGRLGFNPVQLSYDRGLVSFARDVDGTAYAFRSTPGDLGVMDSALQYRGLTFDHERLVRVDTSAGTRTDYTRDALGRVTEIREATMSSDRVTRLAYDAANHVTTVTDPDSRVSRATYDAAGNLTSSTDGDNRATTFTYDAAGHVTSATDPLGRTTTTYDANGLPLSITAGGLTTSQTYNARGLVTTSTDAYGTTSTIAYDTAGRPTSLSRPGTPTVTIARTQVAGGEQVVVTRGSEVATTVTDRYGRVVSSSAPDGATTIAYDPITGLAASTTTTLRGQTQTMQASYTSTGDAAAIWINGQQRQSAARTVPPGNAWFPQEMGGQP